MVLGVVFLALLGFALTAAIYLPLVPFLVWTVAGLHWLSRVFEALVAAPVWAVGFLKNGRGLTGDTMSGWLALLSLLLTPALMVIGLLAATVISYALLTLVSGLFLTVSVNAMSGNVTGPVVADRPAGRVRPVRGRPDRAVLRAGPPPARRRPGLAGAPPGGRGRAPPTPARDQVGALRPRRGAGNRHDYRHQSSRRGPPQRRRRRRSSRWMERKIHET